nr:DUF5714 domain-containing protein [uncultured Merdimonas sp.]
MEEKKRRGACLVCGEDLVYFQEAKEMTCVFCGKKELSHASCKEGHYVCDACHAEKGIEAVMQECETTKLKNPIAIMQKIMKDPYIYMHGPEHHVMAGAALLAAYHNSGGKVDLSWALNEMKERGSQVPGGVCGFWGCCGAGISTGIYMSIITKATPLSGKSWGLSNRMTARALEAIGKIGGPRCCKRDTFTAVREAVLMTKEELGIEMELPEKIECGFYVENQQCLRQKCPYHPKGTGDF